MARKQRRAGALCNKQGTNLIDDIGNKSINTVGPTSQDNANTVSSGPRSVRSDAARPAADRDTDVGASVDDAQTHVGHTAARSS
jgi:hypothetical protein